MSAIHVIPLAEGARLIAQEDTRYKTARLTVHFQVPLAQQTASRYALLGALLARCCAEYPTRLKLNRKLTQCYAGDLSANTLRLGDNQLISLGVTMIDARYIPESADFASECVALLCESIFRPALDESGKAFCAADVESERRQMLENLAARYNEKRGWALLRCTEEMFASEAYGISEDGDPDITAHISPEELYESWQALLQTAQITVTATGVLNSEAIAMAFRSELSHIRRAPIACATAIGKMPTEPKTVTEHEPVNQTKMVLGFRSTVAEPDERATAMRLMNALFGGTEHSLLFRNVREKQSLCYYCSSTYDRQKGVLFVNSGIAAKDIDIARSAVLEQLQALCDGNFTDEELENVRRAMCDAFRKVNDNLYALEYWYVMQMNAPKARTPEEAEAEIRRCTRAEVIEAAKSLKLDTVYLLTGEEASV